MTEDEIRSKFLIGITAIFGLVGLPASFFKVGFACVTEGTLIYNQNTYSWSAFTSLFDKVPSSIIGYLSWPIWVCVYGTWWILSMTLPVIFVVLGCGAFVVVGRVLGIALWYIFSRSVQFYKSHIEASENQTVKRWIKSVKELMT